MLTEGEQDARSQGTPPAPPALAELHPKTARWAQSTADPATSPGPHFPPPAATLLAEPLLEGSSD